MISSKAGYYMWPGPYGDGGSRKYIISSCDQSLKRMGLQYFDIFYSHRFDPDTPLDETVGALDTLVKQGKALYVGVSNYSVKATTDAVAVSRINSWSPITIHQPRYNMLDRGIEKDLMTTATKFGMGIIPYCPLASGILTEKYLRGNIPAHSRAAQKWGSDWIAQNMTAERHLALQSMSELAKARGQTLPQLALAWTLRHPEVTSALIGASSVEQIKENVGALQNLDFTASEIKAIDRLVPA